jgi:hypothetical protein
MVGPGKRLAWLARTPYSPRRVQYPDHLNPIPVSCPELPSLPADRHPLPQSEAAQRFALAIASHLGAGDTATEVRDAACDYVRELRERSLPPERVLVHIKEMLRTLPGRDDDDEEQRHLVRQVITWCIEAYYGAS